VEYFERAFFSDSFDSGSFRSVAAILKLLGIFSNYLRILISGRGLGN
jgi:hypothetical protein